MPQPAATGEQHALRGYRWQYDHIAALVYDALYEQDFVSLRLADPSAGRVDDLVLERLDRIDAYQFKSAESDGYVTFNQLVRNQRTHGGAAAPSIVRSLGDGWKSLTNRAGNAHVHLMMQQLASVRDQLGTRGSPDRPPKDHFYSFLKEVLEPLRIGNLTCDEVPAGWQPALSRLREASGVAPEEFEVFLRHLHFDLNAGTGVPQAASVRKSDILALSGALSRLVSQASGVVELDETGVLTLMGWMDRTRLRSRHEFPVDLATYAPLVEAIDQLNRAVAENDSGYVGVIGPPGAGKSTLLSQALTGSTHRVIRYYAYVPKAAGGVRRLTAGAFLHDVVLMLYRSGLSPHEPQMTGRDVDELRQQLVDRLDSASREFIDTQRRTIVVVDGLDHVDRDYAGSDGLLSELPRPEALPPGVLFVIGSRTLDPLRTHAQQQLEERQAVIDLQHHTLSPASVLDICRRAPVTADLAPELHQLIVELSGGYPLALSYLLNRLQNADGSSAEEILTTVPAYQGDIAAEYRAVWDQLKDDTDMLDILTVCSRLRIGFTTEWLSEWKPDAAVMRFRSKLLYLFRKHYDGWRFFHDSFRQFASDHTAYGDDGSPDADVDARAHGRVAELCSRTDDPRVAAEQLYHRYYAREEDEVLRLAEQTRFREQYRQLRSPDLIREDIQLALGVAAERAEVSVMFRLLLSLWELSTWTSALETVDMPSLLYETGLVHEAIAYCSGGDTSVPLAQAFNLAARLGADNDPAGLQIFRSIEHEGLNDSKGVPVAGHEHDTAMAWARAAAWFLPPSTVMAAVSNLAVVPLATNRRERNEQIEYWERYVLTMETLVDAVAQKGDEASLEAIDTALTE
ncbi:MAG: ATP-binding protein, partial [Caldilineaceae bacterium SB0668_bin_21]|nr:ATP-binding protein [Caldilineaceae bacterium SB0668_bin_21]